MELLGVTGGAKAEHGLEGAQVLDFQELPYVALDVGLDVGGDPEIALVGMERRLRIRTVPDQRGKPGARQARLQQAEREEVREGDPAGERLADASHELELLRAREQPTAVAVAITI